MGKYSPEIKFWTMCYKQKDHVAASRSLPQEKNVLMLFVLSLSLLPTFEKQKQLSWTIKLRLCGVKKQDIKRVWVSDTMKHYASLGPTVNQDFYMN